MKALGGVVTISCLFGFSLGCGDEPAPPAPPYEEVSAPMFAPDHLLEIEIEVAEADWDVLRVEHYDLFRRLVDECPGPLPAEPYTVFPATVTIDGEVFADVGIRKKGFLGSANRHRPSLKLSFDEYQVGREVYGLERLTLNNNQQDASQLDACLAYQVFRDAGVPAPRCNWARVSVNGEDLGIYSNVESIRRRFLGLHFDDSNGNLYEGQVADLRDVWVDNYEEKPGNDGNRADLAALVNALETGDSGLLAALEPVLDIDAFLTFSAAEVLVGHWDGYGGNRNNHYLYRDPSTGQFSFVPWGPDSAFGDPNPFLPTPPPPSVWANNVIGSRLYALPDTHDRYQDAMRELLDTAWDEDALIAEIDRAAAMIAPYVHVEDAAFDSAVGDVKAFVIDQRATLETDLAADPSWDLPLDDSYCVDIIGTVSGTFSATYGDFPPASVLEGTGTLAMTLNGTPYSFSGVTAAAGPDNNHSHPRLAAAPYGFITGGDIIIPVMLVEPELWAADTLDVDGYDVFGILIKTSILTPGVITTLGFLRGTVTFTAAPTAAGENVAGSFELEVAGRAAP